ncbi:MAG TPA: hypothetical protein VNZ53_19700 [Steroidobacteraceae bacterium]|nr:hypothetical protein [Steroidobacteraceae bacterium]
MLAHAARDQKFARQPLRLGVLFERQALVVGRVDDQIGAADELGHPDFGGLEVNTYHFHGDIENRMRLPRAAGAYGQARRHWRQDGFLSS